MPLTEVFRSPFLKAPVAAGHCHAHLMVMRTHNQVNEESAGSQQVQIVTTMPPLRMHAIALELLVNAIHILPRTVIALKLLHLNPYPHQSSSELQVPCFCLQKAEGVSLLSQPSRFYPVIKGKSRMLG